MRNPVSVRSHSGGSGRLLRAGMLAALAAFALLLVQATSASATLQLLKPSPGDTATFVGNGGYSADGLGQNATTGGVVTADVPAGSTVEQAYLYGTYYGENPPPASHLDIDFDGTVVTLEYLTNSEPGLCCLLSTARADVTSQVADKVGGPGDTTVNALTDFAINSDPGGGPAGLDGVALVVIYSNPGLPEATIAVLDGGSNQAGDQVTFNFVDPIDTSTPGFSATMSAGSGFSAQDNTIPGPGGGPVETSGDAGTHQCGDNTNQSSHVDVNGSPLTRCLGNFDDGFLSNGALITVGGVGDSIDNPADPTQEPADAGSPRVEDDEFYNLAPFLSDGDTDLVIDTQNPSSDDNLFLFVIQTTAEAEVEVGCFGSPSTGSPTNGDDVLIGTADPDAINARKGADKVCSLEGADNVVGGPGFDLIDAGPGADIVNASGGHDAVDGGDGDDTVAGGTNADDLNGDGDNDTLNGNKGDDDLDGGAGDDTLNGQTWADHLDGGPGFDTCTGGPGQDTFVNCEVITDGPT